MKTEEIQELFTKFESASSEIEGIECWSARELQQLLGYSKWENFVKVLDKAKSACKNAGEQIADHFPDVRKVIEAGKGAQQTIDDVALMDNSSAVRKMLVERGIHPENLPAAEDVKKVQRKLDGEDKKVLKETKKGTKKK